MILNQIAGAFLIIVFSVAASSAPAQTISSTTVADATTSAGVQAAANPRDEVAGSPTEERPTTWATPLTLDGVPNLYKVDNNLYRSAQPTINGMRNLEKIGIKTVISLRAFHTDHDEITSTGLSYEQIPMKTWHPKREDAMRFLQIVTDPKRAPILVHCQHGADRTGTMCTIYRVAVQKWTKEEALREMREGGYGFHGVWVNLPNWLADLDIERLKSEALSKSQRSPSIQKSKGAMRKAVSHSH